MRVHTLANDDSKRVAWLDLYLCCGVTSSAAPRALIFVVREASSSTGTVRMHFDLRDRKGYLVQDSDSVTV